MRARFLRFTVVVAALVLLVGLSHRAYGQAALIGSRGGQTVTTTPVLPSSLNLPPEAASSLLKGLDASGTALRPGMGWLVSDLSHQGIHGPELADVIHQLKPYKQHGTLTFPQNVTTNVNPVPQPGVGQGQPQQPWTVRGALGRAIGRVKGK